MRKMRNVRKTSKISKIILLLAIISSVSSYIINYNAAKEAKSPILAYRYVSGYFRTDGTYVRGYWRDTSDDGYKYDNADYLGLNDY